MRTPWHPVNLPVKPVDIQGVELSEEAFIERYRALTGCSEAAARSVFINLETVQDAADAKSAPGDKIVDLKQPHGPAKKAA